MLLSLRSKGFLGLVLFAFTLSNAFTSSKLYGQSTFQKTKPGEIPTANTSDMWHEFSARPETPGSTMVIPFSADATVNGNNLTTTTTKNCLDLSANSVIPVGSGGINFSASNSSITDCANHFTIEGWAKTLQSLQELTTFPNYAANFCVNRDNSSDNLSTDLLHYVNASGVYPVPGAPNNTCYDYNGNFVVHPMSGSLLGPSYVGVGFEVGTNGVIVYEYRNGLSYPVLIYRIPATDTQLTGWNHFAVVYEQITYATYDVNCTNPVASLQSVPSLYVNGNRVAYAESRNYVAPWGTNCSNSFIPVPSFNLGGGDYGHFTGLLDNFKIWNTAFGNTLDDHDAIVKIMNNQPTGYESSLVANWPLDLGSLVDVTGNGHNGTNTASSPGVITWSITDQGKNSRTVMSQPKLQVEPVSTQKGIYFDGAHDFYLLDNSNTINTQSAFTNRIVTLVFRTSNDVNSTQTLFKDGNGFSISPFYGAYIKNGILYFDASNDNSSIESVIATVVSNTAYVASFQITGNQMRLILNGTMHDGGTNAVLGQATFPARSGSNFGIGSSLEGFTYNSSPYYGNGNFFNGYIFDLLLHDGITDVERTVIENYYADKYGITLDVADNHFAFSSDHGDNITGIGNFDGTLKYLTSTSGALTVTGTNLVAGQYAMFGQDNLGLTANLSGFNANTTVNSALNVTRYPHMWKFSVTGIARTFTGDILLDNITTGFPTDPLFAKVLLVDMDGDGNFRTGTKVIALAADASGKLKASGVTIPDGAYVSVGYLNQYEFDAYRNNVSSIGKVDQGVYNPVFNTAGLQIESGDNIDADEHFLLGTNTAVTQNSWGTVLTGTGITPSTTVWKANEYGETGNLIFKIDPTLFALPGNDPAVTDYVLLVNPAASGGTDFTNAKRTAFVKEGSFYKTYYINVNDGDYVTIAAAKPIVITPKNTTLVYPEATTQISAPPVDNKLVIIPQTNYPYGSPCTARIQKSELQVLFNTGDDYQMGKDAWNGTVTVTAVGYGTYDFSGTALVTYTTTVTINQDAPEQLWFQDITGDYAKGVVAYKVNLSNFSYPGSPARTDVKPLLLLAVNVVETTTVQVPVTVGSNITNQQVTLPNNRKTFTWDNDHCPVSLYQYQLLRLYNTDPTLTTETSITADLDWSKALTLDVSQKEITLTMAEGTGYYAWRVREVGNYYDEGLMDSRNFGTWSDANVNIPNPVSLTSTTVPTSTSYGNSVFYYTQFDAAKNFIFNRAFTEDNKIHEGISYASGLLQVKQTQAIVPSNADNTPSDGQILVSQSVYDYAGRPVVSSMGAPVLDGNSELSFRTQFMQNSGNLYTAGNFDTDGKLVAPDPVTGGGLYNYYDNSTDATIPSAEGYPFSRSTFLNDGSGRVGEASGVGVNHKIGSGHTVKTEFSAPSDYELVRMFGDEAPNKETVIVQTVTDQNGVISKTYIDENDKTIATCIINPPKQANAPAGSLLPLDKIDFSGKDIVNDFNTNIKYGTNGLISSKDISLSDVTTELDLSYKITPAVVTSACGSYCGKCAYKLTIKVTDLNNPSNTLTNFVSVINFPVGTIDESACAAGVEQDKSSSLPGGGKINLPAGSYKIDKIIELDASAATAYTTAIVNKVTQTMQTVTNGIQGFLGTTPNIPGLNAYLLTTATNPPSGITIAVHDKLGAAVTRTDQLKDGDIITVSATCCTMDIPVRIPDANICDNYPSASPFTPALASSFATDMIELFTKKKTIDANGVVTVSNVDWQTGFQNVTHSNYSQADFNTLLQNMVTDPNFSYTCPQLRDCWSGQFMSIGQNQNVNIDVTKDYSTVNGQGTASVPDWAKNSGGTGLSVSSAMPDPIETFVKCAGRRLRAYSTDLQETKLNYYKYFYYKVLHDNPNCENAFCNIATVSLDPTVPSTTIQPGNPNYTAPCANTPACQVDQELITSTTFHLKYMLPNSTAWDVWAGSTKTGTPAMTNDENRYMAFAGCIAAGQAASGASVDQAKAEQSILDQQAKLEGQCSSACDRKYDSFKMKLKGIFDTNNDGIYANARGTILTEQDICATAQRLVEYCKDQCNVTVVRYDCPPLGINQDGEDRIMSLGTPAELDMIGKIIGGDFALSDLDLSGNCIQTSGLPAFNHADPCLNVSYTFDNNQAKDFSGNHNTTTIVGTPVFGTDGIQVDLSDYLKVDYTNTINSMNTLKSFTLNLKRGATLNTTILTNNLTTNGGFNFYLQGGSVYFTCKNNSNTAFTVNGAVDGLSHKIQVQITDKSIILYLDGTVLDSEVYTGTLSPYVNSSLYIGSDGTTASSGEIWIDNLRIYTCSFTPEEMDVKNKADLTLVPANCSNDPHEAPQVYWDKAFGGETGAYINDFNDFVKTTDGGYLMAGVSNSPNGNEKASLITGDCQYKVWIVKTDANGEKLWEKSYRYFKEPRIALLNNNNAVIIGYSNAAGTTYVTDAVETIKIDIADGTLISSQTSSSLRVVSQYSGTENPVLVTSTGRIFAGFVTQDFEVGNQYYTILEFDNTGAVIWTNGLRLTSLPLNPADNSMINSMIELSDGNLLVGGTSKNCTSPANTNMFAFKWNPSVAYNVSILWQKWYSANDAYLGGNLQFKSMFEYSDGLAYMAGQYDGGGLGVVLKINTLDGTVYSDFTFEDYFPGGDIPGSGERPMHSKLSYLQKSKDGNILVAGSRHDQINPFGLFGEYWITKITSDGHILWDKVITSNGTDGDIAIKFYENTDGSIVLGGNTSSNPSGDKTSALRNNVDYWLVKVGAPVAGTPQSVCIAWQIQPVVVLVTDPIIQETQATIISKEIQAAITNQLNQCILNNTDAVSAEYTNQCVNSKINDKFTITYQVFDGQYTLYYYDRSGHLVKTVPPAGVVLLDASLPDVLSRTTHPSHKLITTYKYNSFNQLTEQCTPDGGKSVFYYDAIGKLRFSQNAQQAVDGTYSYTKYDYLARPIEVGKALLPTGIAFSTLNNTTYTDDATFPLQPASPAPQILSEQTYTVYSAEAGHVSYLGNGQRYLQNRVSYTYAFSPTGDRAVTFYSYDPHGNVEWIVQEIPGFMRATIGYEYDLISNKVLKVKYNEGLIDQYFHRYEYDADNRITGAFTSHDNKLWDKDASYQYYKHGPLKRTGLGEDHIQGLDYAYTIQGWLKGLNTPTLSNTLDPGADGNTTAGSKFANDEYGMVLGYYTDDFKRTGSVYNSDASNTLALLSDKPLYNGNITSWVSRIQKEYTDANFGNVSNNYTTGQLFQYDLLNRIKASDLKSYNGTTYGDPFGVTNAFQTSYSFDENGNLTSLQRKEGTATLMDDFTYTYDIDANSKLNNNKLLYVTDAGVSTASTTDLETQSAGNYLYDKIGNLTHDEAEKVDIKWNVYGKIAEVIPTVANSGKPHLTFTYDASGNRIKKEVDMSPFSGGVSTRDPLLITTSYYVRDASGNTMAVYERKNTQLQAPFAPRLNAQFNLKELTLYGSSRLGLYTPLNWQYNKMFLPGDADKVFLENDVFVRSGTLDSYLVPATAGISMTNSSSQTVSVSNTQLIKSLVEFFPAPISTVASFGGTGSDNVALPTDAANGETDLSMMAFTPKSYFGSANAALLYDADGNLMPGSGGIWSDASTKSAFVMRPGYTSQYYYFTFNLGQIYYHRIDKNAATSNAPGKGDVVAKNQPLDKNSRHDFTGQLEVVEDRVNSKAYILASALNPTTHVMCLVRYVIDNSNDISQIGETQLTENQTWHTAGYGDMQISMDGKDLLLYHYGLPVGWFNSQAAEIHRYDLGYDYRIATDRLEAEDIINVGHAYPDASIGCTEKYDVTYFTVKATHKSVLTADNTTYTSRSFWKYNNNTAKKYYVDNLVYGEIRNPEGVSIVTDMYSNKVQLYQEGMNGVTVRHEGPTLFAAGYKIWGLPIANHRILYLQSVIGVPTRDISNKTYEISDHLGNVTVTISDRLLLNTNHTVSADVASYTNYYAYGMAMPGRAYVGVNYRYGFNGKEKDPEGMGGGGSTYDYGFRIYNPALAKFLSVDPLSDKYPWYTPYQFAGNMPIQFIDIDGLEPGPGATFSYYQPEYYLVEGFRRYFDAGVNLFNFKWETNLFSSDPVKPKSPTKVVTNLNIKATYTGWKFFDPKCWPTGSITLWNAPLPKGELSSKLTVTTQKVIKKQVGNTVFSTKTTIDQNSGEKKVQVSTSSTVVTPNGVPVTISTQQQLSSTGKGTSTVGASVGTSNANVYIQNVTTAENGNVTNETAVGVKVSGEIPTGEGSTIGADMTLEVSHK